MNFRKKFDSLHVQYFLYFCHLLTFFYKFDTLKMPLWYSVRVPNGFDPDQARHSVCPNLDSNRAKVIRRRQKLPVNINFLTVFCSSRL